MANPYTPQQIAGYNANPPSDDASQVASNQVEWRKHLEKIGNPLRNLAESINSQVRSAFNLIPFNGVVTASGDVTITENDMGKVYSMSSGSVALPAANVGPNFMVLVQSSGSDGVVISADSGELINGLATLTVRGSGSAILVSSGSSWVAAVSGGSTTIESAYGAYPDAIDVLSLPNSSLRVVGPTGTSGTVWSQLDVVPATATHLLLKTVHFRSGSNNQSTIHAHANGEPFLLNDRNLVASHQFSGFRDLAEFSVPVSSANEFVVRRLALAESDVNFWDMYLAGWIE